MRVCMLACAHYATDARIKKYVDALLLKEHMVDVFSVGHLTTTAAGLRVYSMLPKFRSQAALPYLVFYLLFFVAATWRVSVASLRNRYSIVHVHNMPDFIVFAALVPRLLGAKIVLDIHDTMPETYATKFGISRSHPIFRLLCLEENLSALFANFIITTNDLQKEALVRRGIPSSKISIIMNVADSELFKPVVRPKTHDGLTIGYHGTIAARLGVDLILEAIRLCAQRCPGLRFVLIGGGDYLPKINRLVAQLKLGSIVTLEGWIPVEQLPAHLASIDVGIVGIRKSYEVHENWALPVKMLEYAALEIPTIAPRLRVITQYFGENATAYYEPDSVGDLADRIAEIYLRREKLDDMVQGLRQFNEKYNWATMERRYFGLISSVLSM